MHTEEPQVNLQTAQDMGLSKEEFELIKRLLGRLPNFTELSVYAVLWSESCSYKHSILWLKTLPREGARILAAEEGDKVGFVDLGHGLACAFKIESHNHFASKAPYQGAATGLGGIHRDIFTLGARPVAALNSLRFGALEQEETPGNLEEVVRGISDYGNRLGIPTVGGEVYFHESYEKNLIVNVMSVGLVETQKSVSSKAQGPGNPVFIVGAPTGKDGIHVFSGILAEHNGSPLAELPLQQLVDPFQEKTMLEATLEAIDADLVIGIHDLGAGGLAYAAAVMSFRGKTGMSIQLDQIPARHSNMSAFQLLLSESQLRLLVVGKKETEAALVEVFQKWDLSCRRIGEVTNTGLLEFHHQGRSAAQLPAAHLVPGGEAPAYQKDYVKPEYLKKLKKYNPNKIAKPKDYREAARKIWLSPNVFSRKWIYEQLDSTVQNNTLTGNMPCDAAVIRIKGFNKGLALTTDCNPSYVQADPYVGAMIAVSEAARNIACSGGHPIALTNCLNFGDPRQEDVYWQFVNAVKGMSDACRKLETPITGGHVSFYNQSGEGLSSIPVPPTPTIGMVGLIEDLDHIMTLHFKEKGHQIYMLGTPHNDFAGSEYLREVHGIQLSPAPKFDLDEEYHNQYNLKVIIRKKMIASAHDISEGGLFVSLLEAALPNELGFDIETDSNFRKDAYLFGESQSRIIVTVSIANEDELVNYLNAHNVSFSKLGEVTGKRILIDNQDFGLVREWKEIYENTLAKKLDNK